MPNLPDNWNGLSFLDHITRLEEECSAIGKAQVAHLGKRAPDCYEALGMSLALLDCAAGCWWGCKGGDHRLEYLIGRAANSAYAAILLLQRGYYDQALSSARGLGEIANLLFLFVIDNSLIDAWKTANVVTRRRDFSPVKVRLALEIKNAPIPIDKERYRLLSGYSIHVEPDAIPQSHDKGGHAKTAPMYQEAGFLLALNEIALPVGYITSATGIVLKLPIEGQKIFRDTGRVLEEAVGGINVSVRGRPWFKLH